MTVQTERVESYLVAELPHSSTPWQLKMFLGTLYFINAEHGAHIMRGNEDGEFRIYPVNFPTATPTLKVVK